MLLQSLHDVKLWCAHVNWSRVAFDTETTSLEWSDLDIEGYSVFDGFNVAYISFVKNPEREAALAYLWTRISSVQEMIGHNLAYDVKVLSKIYGKGVVDRWLLKVRLIDTFLAAFLIDERDVHKLKGPGGCCERFLHRMATDYKTASKASHNSKAFVQYAEADAVNAWDLWEAERPILIEQGLGATFNLECAFIPVQVEMESVGVNLDQKVLAELETKLDLKKRELLDKIDALCGREVVPQGSLFGTEGLEKGLNSPKVVHSYLTKVLGISLENVDVEVLQEHKEKHPLIPLLIEYRRVAKVLSTYLTPYWKHLNPDGRIRTSINIKNTGRLSAKNPALMNWPKESEDMPDVNIRTMLIPSKGNKFLRADYPQQELRIAAHNSGDVTMLKAFSDGIDLHMLVANKGMNLGIPLEHLKEKAPEFKAIKKKYEAVRTKFKAANFGLLYGRAAANLAKDWNCETQEAQVVLDSIFTMFPQLKKHIDAWHAFIRRYGFSYTANGRRRRFKLTGPNSEVQAELRAGFNHTVQGGAADMVKASATAVWRYLRTNRYKIFIVLWIHDEIILDGPEKDLYTVKSTVEGLLGNTMKLNCPMPMTAEIVDNYGTKG